jgi:acyl-coenzyme A thioesterase 9
MLEQLVKEDWVKFTEARFLMVARDPLNRGSAFINPLQVETEEEKELFEKGSINKKRSEEPLFTLL